MCGRRCPFTLIITLNREVRKSEVFDGRRSVPTRYEASFIVLALRETDCSLSKGLLLKKMSFLRNFLAGVFTTIGVALALYATPHTLVEVLTAPTYQVYSLDDAQLAVFITGCSSGIGRHAALSLAAAGYHVFGTVRKETDALNLTQEYQQQKSSSESFMHPIICDVSDPQQINQARDQVAAWLEQEEVGSSRPKILMGIVNNAGMSPAFNLMEHVEIEQDMHPVMNVNVYAPIRVYQAFLPLLRRALLENKNISGSPRIVNVGSLAGSAARPFRGPYTLSKFAMEGLTDTMRQELMRENIAVISVSPGYIATQIGNKNAATSKETYGDKMHRQDLSDTQKRLFDGLVASYLSAFDEAPGPETTTQAIWSALTSTKPMTRYYPGNVKALPAWLLIKLIPFLPVSVLDKMVAPLAPAEKHK